MTVFDYLVNIREKKGGGFFLLLDPERGAVSRLINLAENAGQCEVDAILVGNSFTLRTDFHQVTREIKAHSSCPVILFPAVHSQISPYVDAVLYTSLISGRNPDYLIEEQVRGAPMIKEYGLEPIPTGYMLIESDNKTSVQYISRTMPIPAEKADIVSAHALAAQYLGMKLIYMEAGSGAVSSVPERLIQWVAEYVDLPLIVGGGIRTAEAVERKIRAGASFVVVGQQFEYENSLEKLKEFAMAAHPREQVKA